MDVEDIFRKRAAMMKSLPFFLRGPFRVALRMAIAESSVDDPVRRSQGWKLFLMLPRMLLSRKARGGLVSKEKLRKRFGLFNDGRWEELIRESRPLPIRRIQRSCGGEDGAKLMIVNGGQHERKIWSRWERSPEGEPRSRRQNLLQERLKLFRRRETHNVVRHGPENQFQIISWTTFQIHRLEWTKMHSRRRCVRPAREQLQDRQG